MDECFKSMLLEGAPRDPQEELGSVVGWEGRPAPPGPDPGLAGRVGALDVTRPAVGLLSDKIFSTRIK